MHNASFRASMGRIGRALGSPRHFSGSPRHSLGRPRCSFGAPKRRFGSPRCSSGSPRHHSVSPWGPFWHAMGSKIDPRDTLARHPLLWAVAQGLLWIVFGMSLQAFRRSLTWARHPKNLSDGSHELRRRAQALQSRDPAGSFSIPHSNTSIL